MEKRMGKPMAKGVSVGPLYVMPRRGQRAGRRACDPEREWTRFQQACALAREQMAKLYDLARQSVDGETARIFEVQGLLLEDEDYLDAVREIIETEGCSAEEAALAAGERLAAVLETVDDDYLRERAADLREIGRCVAQAMAKQDGDSFPERPVILAGEEISAADLMRWGKEWVLGAVTGRGAVNGHATILARAMEIPMLSGVESDAAWNGKTAVLDAEAGCLWVEPDEETLERAANRPRGCGEGMGERSIDLHGRTLRLQANAGSLAEAKAAAEAGAEGIGLFRSEFLCLEQGGWPEEEEQFALYRDVLRCMNGRPVVFRTMDLGGDKQAEWLNLGQEENPALGLRGIRLSFAHMDAFDGQLRALLRAAAHGPAAVMFPMVTSLWEVRQAKARLEACRVQLAEQGIPVGELPVGIMVETPAAVMLAEELAREVDFFSIGTNDLTQFVLAADRQNPAVEQWYDENHPAVWSMIAHAVEAAHRHGCAVSVCGELAANPERTQRLLELGVDALSMNPAALKKLRKRITMD